jgi:hypothetical protein
LTAAANPLHSVGDDGIVIQALQTANTMKTNTLLTRGRERKELQHECSGTAHRHCLPGSCGRNRAVDIRRRYGGAGLRSR